MANVFDVYDQRPTSKTKATEYFTWSLKKIQTENWDGNVTFYWHKYASEYCKKRHADIFGAEEEKNKNDATYGKFACKLSGIAIRSTNEFKMTHSCISTFFLQRQRF